MTTTTHVDAGVFDTARITRAMVGTALTAVLAVLFGLSVMVELSNTPDVAPRADKPVLAFQTGAEASSPSAGHAGQPPVEAQPAVF